MTTKNKLNKKAFGFQLGKHIIDIEADTEQKAMLILVKKFWELINDNPTIELLGEVHKVAK